MSDREVRAHVQRELAAMVASLRSLTQNPTFSDISGVLRDAMDDLAAAESHLRFYPQRSSE